jgi:hypothetical protein
VLTSYERLRPFADVIAATPGTFVTDLVPGEMQSFLTYGNVPTVDYSLLAGRERGVALDQFLSEAGVSLIYVDSYLLDQLKDDPGAQALLTSPVSVGWYLVGEQNSASDHWRLLARAVNSGKTSSVRPQ